MFFAILFLQKLLNALLLILQESIKIVSEPIENPNMLWTLVPLVVGMFALEIYFGHYKREKLGWNSAVGNSLVLFFVGMNLLSFLFSNKLLISSPMDGLNLIGSEIDPVRFLIAMFIILEAALLFFLNFFHLIPEKFSFGVSSGLFMNFLACIGIILVYGDLPLTWIIIPAVLLIFFVLLLLLNILELIEPKSWRDEDLIQLIETPKYERRSNLK